MRVLAAVDNTSVTATVLQVAATIAHVLDFPVRACHVHSGGEAPVTAAESAGIPLDVIEGDPVDRITAALADPDVLGVLGARDYVDDPRPAGGVAAEIITTVSGPLVVVGPAVHVPRGAELGRVLVPLDGTVAAAEAVEPLVKLLAEAGVDIAVQHVFDRDTVPGFWDQPHHETPTWSREFHTRWCRYPVATVDWARGTAADAILAAASAENVDLVMMAWAQNSSPGHAAAVKAALREASVPLLLVPQAVPRTDSARDAGGVLGHHGGSPR